VADAALQEGHVRPDQRPAEQEASIAMGHESRPARQARIDPMISAMARSFARAAPPLRRGTVLVLLMAAACSGPAVAPPSAPAPGETRTFEGTWTASGSRRTLDLEPGRKASIFSLTGSLLLTGERGLGVGFQGDVIGFSDSKAGGTGQCVWTDQRGDKVFSQIRGQPLGTGSQVTGTITGGTGRWAGLTGEYELRWQYVIDSDDGTFSGRAVGLKGRVTVPARDVKP
jgi:hypothetical protein